uniref:Uncharacterized protein n=1 Tax=Rhizophora mucronata TaxID=61149 RepID=A0A2P2PVE8_RHIMU
MRQMYTCPHLYHSHLQSKSQK